MTRIYTLDQVEISPRVYHSWLGSIPLFIRELSEKYPDIGTEDIPDEKFRVLSSGIGQIFVKIKGRELKLNVPKNEYNLLV